MCLSTIILSKYYTQLRPSFVKNNKTRLLLRSISRGNKKRQLATFFSKPNRYLAVPNPRVVVPVRYESRLSVAKSLAIYFNTL